MFFLSSFSATLRPVLLIAGLLLEASCNCLPQSRQIPVALQYQMEQSLSKDLELFESMFQNTGEKTKAFIRAQPHEEWKPWFRRAVSSALLNLTQHPDLRFQSGSTLVHIHLFSRHCYLLTRSHIAQEIYKARGIRRWTAKRHALLEWLGGGHEPRFRLSVRSWLTSCPCSTERNTRMSRCVPLLSD